MSTVTFPWQHNGLQALSIQRGNQSFPPLRSVICYCCLFSEYGHYTAQAQESLLNYGATNNAVFILGRKRSGDNYVAMVAS